MLQKQVRIGSPEGLRARAAALLVQKANTYQSEIVIKQGAKLINAKSIMGVLSLQAAPSDSIWLLIQGEDEQTALNSLTDFIENGLE